MAESLTTQNGLVTPQELLAIYTQLVQRLTLRHGVTFVGERNLYDTLGYKPQLLYADYYERYQRGGIAHALINTFAEETWRLPPVVREMEKPDEETATVFETTWRDLAKRLKFWQTCARADRLASIGRYAVLVLGLRGQTDLSLPAAPVRGPDDLLYVQAFSEEHCTILDLVSQDTSPLFMTPRLYNIDFSRRQESSTLGQSPWRPSLAGSYGQLLPVHASRVIHVAHNGLEDDIIGTPSLQAVWNYLDDLDKIVGGTSEMVWKDAKRRFVAALRDGAVLSPEDEAALDDRVKQFAHQLLDVLQVRNIDVSQLSGQVPDASNNAQTLIQLIAGTKRIPTRRLLGSESGELASSQDEGNFASTIASRQLQDAEPLILRPAIDRCITLNILPTPRKGYEIEWMPLLSESEQEKAATALAWSTVFEKFAGRLNSPSDILPLEIFLQDIVGWEKEQVERIIDLLGQQEAFTPRRGRPTPQDGAAEEEGDEAAEEGL